MLFSTHAAPARTPTSAADEAPQKLDKTSAHAQPRSTSQRPRKAQGPRPAGDVIHHRRHAGEHHQQQHTTHRENVLKCPQNRRRRDPYKDTTHTTEPPTDPAERATERHTQRRQGKPTAPRHQHQQNHKKFLYPTVTIG